MDCIALRHTHTHGFAMQSTRATHSDKAQRIRARRNAFANGHKSATLANPQPSDIIKLYAPSGLFFVAFSCSGGGLIELPCITAQERSRRRQMPSKAKDFDKKADECLATCSVETVAARQNSDEVWSLDGTTQKKQRLGEAFRISLKIGEGCSADARAIRQTERQGKVAVRRHRGAIGQRRSEALRGRGKEEKRAGGHTSRKKRNRKTDHGQVQQTDQ